MYPSKKQEPVEEPAVKFLKDFSPTDYSFKGQPSAERSNLSSIFGLGGGDAGLFGMNESEKLS
jgi:hypothetical protein